MPGSRHSNQVCFPGGGVDAGETDLEAGIREVREEVGLDLLRPDCVYIGKSPINKYLYLRRGKKTYLSNLVFLSLDGLLPALSPELKNDTNPDSMPIPNSEVDLAWWVPYNIFFEDSKDIFVLS